MADLYDRISNGVMFGGVGGFVGSGIVRCSIEIYNRFYKDIENYKMSEGLDSTILLIMAGSSVLLSAGLVVNAMWISKEEDRMWEEHPEEMERLRQEKLKKLFFF